MHVALIVDEERLAHEHTTLNRLSIGLIGEGIQLTRIVPDTLTPEMVDSGEQRVALATRISAPMRVLPWLRRERTTRILEAMEKSPPEVCYAMGDEAWPVALDLARALKRPLAIDVWSAAQIRRVPRGRRAAVAAYIAATRPIAEGLGQRVDPGLVCLVPTGVAVPPTPREVLDQPNRSIALAVLGGGRDMPAYRALLSGLSRLVRDRPQIQIFLELRGPNEHEIWRHARRLELLPHVSTLMDAAWHRTLLTRCDVILLPERYGEMRSIMLEAMAFGVPLVASDDPYLDMLVDGESAALVHDPEPEAWAKQVLRLVSEPEIARSLGASARDLVARMHRSSDHVEMLVTTFQRIATGGSYPFTVADT